MLEIKQREKLFSAGLNLTLGEIKMRTVQLNEFAKRFEPEVRSRYLGATDFSILMGAEFEDRKAYNVWQEKVGLADPPNLDWNDAVLMGKIFEDEIAKVYSDRYNQKVRNVNKTLVHPNYSYMRGHIDRKIEGKNAGLEIKTVGIRTAHNWGEPETDEIPYGYKIQVLQYMAITGYDYFDVYACFLGFQEFRLYRIWKKDYLDLIKEIEETGKTFWEEYVLTETPPPPKSSKEAAMHFDSAIEGKTAILSDSEILWNYYNLEEELKRIKGEFDQAKMAVQLEFGDAEYLQNAQGYDVATWKNQTSKRLDTKRALKERPELLKEFPLVTNSRTLRIKRRREDDE